MDRANDLLDIKVHCALPYNLNSVSYVYVITRKRIDFLLETHTICKSLRCSCGTIMIYKAPSQRSITRYKEVCI